jgi:hypothetical protein
MFAAALQDVAVTRPGSGLVPEGVTTCTSSAISGALIIGTRLDVNGAVQSRLALADAGGDLGG